MSRTRALSRKAQATRQRILDAAVQVFSSKGYHEARMDEIVEVAESSKGSVYFHFPSKEKIFLALIDEFARKLEQQLLEVIAREPDGVHRVDAALRVCLETFSQYRSLAKIFLVQAVGLGQTFEEKRLEIHQRFVKIIQRQLDQAVADGDLPPLDTEVAALAWMGAINEVVIRWVYTGQPEPTRMLPTLRIMLLRSIRVSEQRIQALADASSL